MSLACGHRKRGDISRKVFGVLRYTILQRNSHSGLRYSVVLLLIYVVYNTPLFLVCSSLGDVKVVCAKERACNAQTSFPCVGRSSFNSTPCLCCARVLRTKIRMLCFRGKIAGPRKRDFPTLQPSRLRRPVVPRCHLCFFWGLHLLSFLSDHDPLFPCILLL